MVKTMLLVILLPFIQTLIMFKKMTSIECCDVIDVALNNLEGVVDVVSNMQHEEILELCQRPKRVSLLNIES